jgi:predicted transcriptional regulator
MYLMDLGKFTWDGMVKAFAKKAAKKKVEKFMTRKVIPKEDSTLMECVDHMLKNKVKRVPVLNKENKVAGMLYERDVFYAITKAMLDENAEGGT